MLNYLVLKQKRLRFATDYVFGIEKFILEYSTDSSALMSAQYLQGEIYGLFSAIV